MILGGIKRNATPRTGLAGSSTLQIWKLISPIWDAESQCTCVWTTWGCLLKGRQGWKRPGKNMIQAPQKWTSLRHGAEWLEGNVNPTCLWGSLCELICCWKKCWTNLYEELLTNIRSKNHGVIQIFLIRLNQIRLNIL